MKRIAIICHDHSLSGANLSLIDYLKNYNRERFDVKVFFPMKQNSGMADELKKISVSYGCYKLFVIPKELKKLSFKRKLKRLLKRAYNFIFGSLHYKRLKKSLSNYELIISNSFSVLYGAKIAVELKIPHVFHIREFMEEDHQITHYNLEEVEKLCIYSSAVFISNSIKQYYLNKYRFKSYKVIYNKIHYENSFIKSKKFYSDNILTILMVGTLQQNKGQFDAIRAVELLKDKIKINLIICGQGVDAGVLKKYCKEHLLNNVHFLGQVHKEELLEIRKNVDISLVCSKMEALGRVTVESMFYESLTIGADCGETAYLLSDGRGYLYEYGDYDKLSKLIIRSVNEILEVNEIIKRAKNFALEKFSNDILTQILE